MQAFETLTDIRHHHQSEQFFPLVYDRGVRKELKKVGYGIPELFLPMYRFFGYQQAIKNGLLEAFDANSSSRTIQFSFSPKMIRSAATPAEIPL